MSTHLKHDVTDIYREMAVRRQSRVYEFNQLSKAPANFDPRSAESPALTPETGPSRAASQISLSSLVRSQALGTRGESPCVQLLGVQHSRTSSSSSLASNQGSTCPLGTNSTPASHTSKTAAAFIPNSTTGVGDSRDTANPSLHRVASAKRFRATTLDVPGLTRSKISPDGRIARDDIGAKLVIVMVGLPARGKSYITKKLARFLNWQQHDCRIFNVGNTRRRAGRNVGPSMEPLPDGKVTEHEGDFFSPDNPKTVALREKWAEDTLQELLDYVLDGDGSVGILDATNTTSARRRLVMKIINERSNGQLKVLFLESICTHRHIIESNVRLKLSGPDYKHMDQTKAIEDFLVRLRNYEKAYEPISKEEESDRNFQYIKFINVGEKFECGNIKGFLAGQTVFFLLNFNLTPRQIWITRHGESTDNQLGRIGGDAGLTERGWKYASALAEFMKFKKKEFQERLEIEAAERLQILKESGSQAPTPENEPVDQNFCVWTSMLRRTIETASHFSDNEFDIKQMRMLNELDPGICNGMTYQEIKEKYASEYEARMQDKILYRYPGIGGESYLDVINRLRPVIVEMERMEDNCLIICHRVVARVLLSYFMNLGRDAIGDLEVPLHTLYVLEPKPYGVHWALYKYSEKYNWFYKVSPEGTRVQSQLNDHKRRYTVVPTAGMALGGDSPSGTHENIDNSICPSNHNAIVDESSSSDGEEIITRTKLARFQFNSHHTPSLQEAVEKRLKYGVRDIGVVNKGEV